MVSWYYIVSWYFSWYSIVRHFYGIVTTLIETRCDEWGGAESRGNGARPVELMIMSDTCATHRSRVPRRSCGRIKGGAMTKEDERGPGLDFNLCFVCGSRPWGAAALLLCLFIFIKLVLNVRRFPPPSSRSTNFVTLGVLSLHILLWTMKSLKS